MDLKKLYNDVTSFRDSLGQYYKPAEANILLREGQVRGPLYEYIQQIEQYFLNPSLLSVDNPLWEKDPKQRLLVIEDIHRDLTKGILLLESLLTKFENNEKMSSEETAHLMLSVVGKFWDSDEQIPKEMELIPYWKRKRSSL